MFFIAEGTVQIYDPDDLSLVNVEVRPSAPLAVPPVRTGRSVGQALHLLRRSVSARSQSGVDRH